MKTRLLLSTLGLSLLMAACQKEDQAELDQKFAPPPSDRCGCMAPVELNANNATDVSIDLSWNAMPEAIAYSVEVADRFNGTDAFNDVLFSEILEGTRITVTHLAPNTQYEFRVTTLCANEESSISETAAFVTGDFHHGDPDPRKTKAQGQKTAPQIQ